MGTRTITSIMGKCVAVLAVAIALSAVALALPAYANIELNAPTTVSDDITRVHVAKLDADTHEYVTGAVMQIIEKDTGTVIDEWVSKDGEVHEYEKGTLVVERPYILRELEAPEGYTKVDDVEFIINKDEGKGLSIISGTSTQFEQTSLDQITLYDKAGETEIVTTVTETRPTSSSTTTTRAAAPKTGDNAPMALVASLVVLGIVAIIVLQIPKRRME